MHRSGTSCVSYLLTKLGVYFGDPSVSIGASDQNPKGFFERTDVRDICDTILQSIGCDWWAVNDFSVERVPSTVRVDVAEKFAGVLEDLEEHRPWFVKEPRLCLVWPLLRLQATNAVFLHVWRHPIEVATSLAKRNGFPLDFGVALWECYIRSAFAVSHGRPSVIVSYNALIKSPLVETRRLVRSLQKLGVPNISVPAKETLEEAVDPELYRNQNDLFELDDLIAPSQRKLLDALVRGDATNSAFAAPLSQVARARIADWTRREGIVVSLSQKVSDGKRITSELSAARSRAIESERKAAVLAGELATLNREKAQIKQELSKFHNQRVQADHWQTEIVRASEAWASERASLASQIDLLKERVDALKAELGTKDENSKQLEGRIASLAATLRDSDVRVEELVAELSKKDTLVESLHAELRKKDSSAKQLEGRVTSLTAALHASDAYVDVVVKHAQMLRKVDERREAEAKRLQTTSAFDRARAGAIIQCARTPLGVLLKGLRKSRNEAITGRGLAFLWAHYFFVKRRRDASNLAILAASGLFDESYYRAVYPDVAAALVDPLIHYVDLGARERRNPSTLFDAAFYLKANPDVAECGINPLLHFVRHGHAAGRASRPVANSATPENAWTLPPPPRSLTAYIKAAPEPKRIVVYTAVVGGYDQLQPPGFDLPGCDFVAFSDQEIHVEGWQVRPLNYFHEDPTRAARFVKLHPHVYFPDHDHSIWIDGNIGIRGDIRKFLRSLTFESPIGIFPHPLRDCIYVEGAECIKRKKDYPDVIDRHLDRYRAQGVPEKMGLWETNIVARRHNDEACIALMTAWWREMEIGSRRDQISLPVVTRRLSVSISALGPAGANARDHELVTLVKHPPQRIEVVGKKLPAVARKAVPVDALAIDIGVCVHNSLDETRACLESALKARRPQDRIVVVDDASDGPTANFLKAFAAGNDGVKLISHEQNRGYTVSANDVFRERRGDWVVLLNSDAVVPPRAFTKLIAAGEQFDRLGIIGPLSNAASWQTVPQLTGADGKFLTNTLPDGMSVEDMDRLCEELAGDTVLFSPLVNGFCYAVRRKLIERIGLFDETQFPKGYGEEDDFCLRAGEAGYLCGITADTYVYHAKSASFTPQGRLPLAAAGGKALREKHSPERVQAAVEVMKRHPQLKRIRENLASHLAARAE